MTHDAEWWLRQAAEAIRKRHAGPAHRHLMRAWDAGLDDDAMDRFAELSERLDVVEKAAGMRWGQPVEDATGWSTP